MPETWNNRPGATSLYTETRHSSCIQAKKIKAVELESDTRPDDERTASVRKTRSPQDSSI